MYFIITILVILFLIAIFGKSREDSAKQSVEDELKQFLREKHEDNILDEYLISKESEAQAEYSYYDYDDSDNYEEEYEYNDYEDDNGYHEENFTPRIYRESREREILRAKLHIAHSMEQRGQIEEAVPYYEELVDVEGGCRHAVKRLCIYYRKKKLFNKEVELIEKVFNTYELSTKDKEYYEYRLDRAKNLLKK